ncbi:MAG: hypothetical protein ABWX90_02435 [Candidatus Saccharimonadales bacterium]
MDPYEKNKSRRRKPNIFMRVLAYLLGRPTFGPAIRPQSIRLGLSIVNPMPYKAEERDGAPASTSVPVRITVVEEAPGLRRSVLDMKRERRRLRHRRVLYHGWKRMGR